MSHPQKCWCIYNTCLIDRRIEPVSSSVNPFTAMLAALSPRKRPMKVANLKSVWLLFSFFFSPSVACVRERTSIETHGIERKFVIGLSNILIADVYVCTFQPGNYTSWGSEGVNRHRLRSEQLTSK